MAKQELMTMENFHLVTGYEGMDDDLKEELMDAMEDMDEEKGIVCRQIKVPSGGGKAFEVEGDDPDDPEVMKEIEAVILFTHRMNSYWEGEFGSEDNKLPVCSSYDAKKGIVLDTGEIRDCETCSLNQYGEDGTGKPCKNIRRVYMMLSGRSELYLLSVPPTSIKDVNKQLARIMGSNKVPYTRMVVKFSLEKAKNKGGIEYSKVVVNKCGMLPEAYFQTTAALRKELKEKYMEVAITADDYNTAEKPTEDSFVEVNTAEKPTEDGFVEVPENAEDELPFA